MPDGPVFCNRAFPLPRFPLVVSRSPSESETSPRERDREPQQETEPLRLTLRTLLAYLDDTLEGDQVKVIGQKVAESDTAQELIARIKQVTRRRRLTTP